MKGWLQLIGIALLVLGFLSIGPIIKYKNYSECRAHGFSRFFCITH